MNDHEPRLRLPEPLPYDYVDQWIDETTEFYIDYDAYYAGKPAIQYSARRCNNWNNPYSSHPNNLFDLKSDDTDYEDPNPSDAMYVSRHNHKSLFEVEYWVQTGSWIALPSSRRLPTIQEFCCDKDRHYRPLEGYPLDGKRQESVQKFKPDPKRVIYQQTLETYAQEYARQLEAQELFLQRIQERYLQQALRPEPRFITFRISERSSDGDDSPPTTDTTETPTEPG